MADKSPAARFIEESVNHPVWLRAIEAGEADTIVLLAKEHGFESSLEELKQAARELLGTSEEKAAGTEPTEKEVDEAASGMSNFENTTGYGDDTGYAALYGVAGMILKA